MDNRPSRIGPTQRLDTINRQPQPAAAPEQTATRPALPPADSGHRPAGRKKLIIAALALTLLVILGLVSWYLLGRNGGEISRVNKNEYQAVFLANDQVYFGKITSIDDNVLVITDIYYLQQQPNQPAADNKNAQAKLTQPNLSLAKRGSELQGPEDTMNINKQQVLFWENLKPDGKVTQGIKQYKK